MSSGWPRAVIVAARGRGFAAHDGKHAAHAAVRSYRERMHAYAGMSALDIYYSHVDVAEIMDYVDKRARPYLASTVKAATHHDALAAFAKLTAVDDDGALHLVDRPPTMFHSPLMEQADPHYALRHYRSTLQEDRRAAARPLPVRGWGDQGRRRRQRRPRRDRRPDDRGCVRRPALPPGQGGRGVGPRAVPVQSPFENHGERVVAGQRRLQAASDILLGWTKGRLGRHVYVRQLHDQKGSAVIEAMTARRPQDLGRAVRLGAGARACSVGRPGIDRRLPRRRRRVRPRHRRVRGRLRGSDRARLRRVHGGDQGGHAQGRVGRLSRRKRARRSGLGCRGQLTSPPQMPVGLSSRIPCAASAPALVARP